MRTGLQGLTTRGRSFLAAGITATSAAVVLGQSSLVRIGLLLTFLPLICAWGIGRTKVSLQLSRTLQPKLVAAGQASQLTLTLVNTGRRSTGVLRLEEQLPYALGARPRFVLDGMRSGETRSMQCQLRSDLRGRFQIGPLSVRVQDAFGLIELERLLPGSESLIVTPRTVALPDIPVGGVWAGSGDNRPRSFATGSAEDVTVRDYRVGDDLRRVHWRSSARKGELMVRREEQPWQSRATLFIDNRASAHRGSGPASSLETAVLHAASIAAHLSRRGFQVRLVTAAGADEAALWHDRAAALNLASTLESLAVLEPSDHTHLATDWLAEQHRDGLFVAVLGHLDDHDHASLRRMRVLGNRPLAVALDVEQWVGRGDGADASWLSGLGWTAVSAGPSDSLPMLWRELGRKAAPHPNRSRGGGR